MDNKNKMAKALSELADEMNSFSELSGEIRDLKEVITDSNEELIATFVEGTKRILKKETKDNTRDIKSLESSVVESLNSLKRGISEVERGVKAIKLPSNTDFRATGAMLKLPIKELTRAVKEQDFKLSTDAKNPIAVRLSDGENFYKALENFIQQVSGGGATSYAFDTQQSSPTKAATVKVSISGKERDALVVVNPDGTNIAGGSSGGGLTDAELRATPVPVSLTSTTITGSVAVTNAGITTIAGAVSGSEMQVDVLTMPTVTVTATNLDVQSGGADLATSTQAGAIQTSVELLDDTVATLGTTTYTEATTKGLTIGAVRRDADTTLVNTTNEIGPLQMDANGRLKVEVFSGETLPVSLTSTTVTGTVAVTQSGTWDEVGINDSGNSITVDYATTGSGTATGALRVELPTNGTGVIATVGAVTAITNALPAGTNAIGKLAANSGVDIGDVDVTSISAGTNLIGDVGIQPRTTNGLDTFMASGSDGSSILVATAQAVKASAGKVYGYYLYNPESAVTFVHFYNTASGGVTVGTTSPLFTLQIPPASAANLMSEIGITFGTAITIAATTTAGGNTAPATGVSATIWFK